MNLFFIYNNADTDKESALNDNKGKAGIYPPMGTKGE